MLRRDFRRDVASVINSDAGSPFFSTSTPSSRPFSPPLDVGLVGVDKELVSEVMPGFPLSLGPVSSFSTPLQLGRLPSILPRSFSTIWTILSKVVLPGAMKTPVGFVDALPGMGESAGLTSLAPTSRSPVAAWIFRLWWSVSTTTSTPQSLNRWLSSCYRLRDCSRTGSLS